MVIGWANRNDYNIYSDGLVVHTTIDARLQAMATQAVTWQTNQLQSVANRAWSGRDGCSTGNPLFVTFIRESAEYRAARTAGQSDADATKQLARDRSFIRALCVAKTDVQAGFLATIRAPVRFVTLGWVAATSRASRSITWSKRGGSRARRSSHLCTAPHLPPARRSTISSSTSRSKSHSRAGKFGARPTRHRPMARRSRSGGR